jgi:hypothetical protein
MKDNAAYQLFCGRGSVDTWHSPDHTKIEEFHSRLSPETQRQVANQVVGWATELGFANPSVMDIDSTVQEANIAYTSDAHLMVKMTLLVHKVWTYMKLNISFFADFTPAVDVKAVKAKAKAYFFRDRTHPAHATAALQALWHEAFTQIGQVRKYFDVLLDYDIQRMPWNIQRALHQVNAYCSTHFLHVASFLCRGVVVPDKALSFHTQAVRCFNKGKAAKGLQFGRAFQLGRIGGNFLLVASCTSLRMEDTTSVCPMIVTHQDLFGVGVLTSSGMDKGYYSGANRMYLQSLEGLKEFCLQQPGLDTRTLSKSDEETLAALWCLLWMAERGGGRGSSEAPEGG